MALRKACLMVAAGVVVCGACGKRGDPLPPLRQTPQPPQVRLAQRGDEIEIAFTAPPVAVKSGDKPPALDLEVLRASGGGDFKKLAKLTRRAIAPGETTATHEPLPAPGTVLRIAARVVLKGRPSPQGAPVVLTVQAPPEPPRHLAARLPGSGVSLQWTPPEHMPVPPPPPSPSPAPSPGAHAAASAPPASPPAAAAPPSPGTAPSPASAEAAASPSPEAAPAAASPSPAPKPSPSPRPPSTGFWVYRRAKTEASYGRPLVSVPLQEHSYEDTTAAMGDTLCYVVTTVAATDAPVESEFSNEVCVDVKDVTPPGAPIGLAVLMNDAAAEISWSPSPEPDLASYRLYRAVRGSAPELVATIAAGTTLYKDATLEAGKVYAYTLVAVDKAGNESPTSAPVPARRP